LIIGETSGAGERRADWARAVMEESVQAIDNGVDLQGVCFYPAIDIPDWNSSEWAHIGLCDVDPQHGLARRPVAPYIAELQCWQHRFTGSLAQRQNSS
jgi:beta-glucosidase/6-phospho-beta-glucosidase/beta-galactosidase